MEQADGVCILVVEDDAAARNALRDVLREAGYQVVSAEDGAAALGAIDGTSTDPDLVLLDLNMPHMNGNDFLDCLRSRPESRRTPVIVVTGAPRPSIPAKFGDMRIVRKPFDVGALLDVIHAVIASTPAGRN